MRSHDGDEWKARPLPGIPETTTNPRVQIDAMDDDAWVDLDSAVLTSYTSPKELGEEINI